MINAPVTSLGLPGAWSGSSRLDGALSSCFILINQENLDLLLPPPALDASSGKYTRLPVQPHHNSQC